MNGLPEGPALDVSRTERAHQGTGIHAEPFLFDEDSVHPIGTFGPWGVSHRYDARQLLEFLGIACSGLALGGDIHSQLLHLRTTDRRQEVGQAIVITDFPVNVLDRVVLGLGGKVLGSPGPLLVICDDHSTAARSDYLVTVETETRNVAEAAHGTPLVSRTQCLRRVLNHFEAEPSRDRKDGIQINGMTE